MNLYADYSYNTAETVKTPSPWLKVQAPPYFSVMFFTELIPMPSPGCFVEWNMPLSDWDGSDL